jgi:hypothetical protein
MAFIRTKTLNGVNYYYLVENKRQDGKVKQNIVKYFGTTIPDNYVVPTEKRHAVVPKEAIKKISTTKTIAKSEAKSVSTTVLKATPLDLQIRLQRRAAKNNMTAEEYLNMILKSNHRYDKNGKRLY